jgi:uncharacterized protein
VFNYDKTHTRLQKVKGIQMIEPIKTGFYSLKQFLIASILGGPAIGGFIVTLNLWAKQKRYLAFIPAIIGLLLDLLLIIPVYFSVQHINSILYRNFVAIVLLFILQAIVAFLFRHYFKKNNKANALIFSAKNIKAIHTRKLFPLILICLIYFVTDFIFPFYFWIFLAFYLIPHFYIYIRIYNEFSNKKIAKIVLSGVVFLGSLVPMVYSTGEIVFAIMGRGSLFYTYLNYAIGFYITFVFYFLLFIIALQLLKLINSVIHLLPSQHLKNKKIKLLNIVVINICALLITGYGFYNNNKPVVKNYNVTVPQKESTLKSLKVVCIADLHLKEMTSKKFLRKLTAEINNLQPDIIVIPGDVIEFYGNANSEKLKEFSCILLDLSAKYGVYVTNGNHDYHNGIADSFSFFNHSKTTILMDSLVEVDKKFCVMGLIYRGNHEKRPIDSILQFKTQDLPLILLDHAPYCLEEAIQNKIDIQFSGHTHNGQIWPLNYIVSALYENSWGYRKYDETNLFVTCGVQDALLPGRQDVSIPVRIGSSPDILEIDIEFKKTNLINN